MIFYQGRADDEDEGLQIADAKGLKLAITSDCAPKQVIADSQRVQQIITNLLSNAIRYTATGSIELHCRQVGAENWAIAITDTGIGIAPADKNRTIMTGRIISHN